MSIFEGIKIVIDDTLSPEEKADIIINELRTKPQYKLTNDSNNKESILVSGIALLKHLSEGEFNFLVKKLSDEGLIYVKKENDIIIEIGLEYKGYFHEGFVKIKNDKEEVNRLLLKHEEQIRILTAVIAFGALVASLYYVFEVWKWYYCL
jgi:hypothetical protein